MRFQKLTPMLQTLRLGETVAWYERHLGMRVVARLGDEWCCLARDGVELMFMHNDHLGAPQATATQYFQVDDVPALWDALRDHVTVEWAPARMDYGMVEFAIRDPNGYLLSFGQPAQ